MRSRASRQLLNDCAKGDEFARFLPAIETGAPARDLRCRAAVASTLVAGLELARGGTVALDQKEPWASIRLRSVATNGREVPAHDRRAGG